MDDYEEYEDEELEASEEESETSESISWANDILCNYTGKEIRNPVKAIKQHCLECSCYQRDEVKLCPCTSCFLWPFRFGKNPYRSGKRKPLTDEQREALRQRLKKSRTKE